MKRKTALTTALLLALGLAGPAQADEREQLELVRQTTLNLIKLLVQQKVLTQEAADQLIHQAEATAKAEVTKKEQLAGGANVVRVPYIPETVKNEIQDNIKQQVLAQAKTERWGEPDAYPSWLHRFTWYGDIRLRYQRNIFPAGNTPLATLQAYGPTSLVTDSSVDQNLTRVRARLGAKIQVSDNVVANVRFATGNLTTPVSTNQTEGMSGNYQTLLDLAYLQATPYSWLRLTGGRFENPFFHTDLVWAPDLKFDGFAGHAEYWPTHHLKGFVTVGLFPLQFVNPSDLVQAKDKWLYGLQGGLDWYFADESKATLAAALYDYRHVEGVPNPAIGSHVYDATAPQFRQKGNSVMFINYPGDPTLYGLASKFRELNLTGRIDIGAFDPVHVVLTGDYVRNVGFSRSDILARTGQDIAPQVNGYMGKIAVGIPKIEYPGDWQTYVAYKYLERDAVLDAFADPDFHLGGTDAKGYILGGSYGVARNTWLNLKWLSADQISGPPLSIDVLQLDLNSRF